MYWTGANCTKVAANYVPFREYIRYRYMPFREYFVLQNLPFRDFCVLLYLPFRDFAFAFIYDHAAVARLYVTSVYDENDIVPVHVLDGCSISMPDVFEDL